MSVGTNCYGKRNVRFLRVVKDSPTHEVFEMTGYCLLEGPFEKSYTDADNSTILPTETQKNTFYALSKKYPIDPIERWCCSYGKDLLARHSHITAVSVSLDRNPFQRIVVDGKEHNHAFYKGSDGTRFVNCRVTRSNTTISAGFKDLIVMKTAQSGFEGYIVDEYTTLPSTGDRVLSTNIYCEWQFIDGIDVDKTDFNAIAAQVKEITLKTFAGPADTGVYSASVQKTAYNIGKEALAKIPALKNVKFVLPNIHYYPVDFTPFKSDLVNKGEVFLTFEGAAGDIRVTINRNPVARL